LNVYNRIKPALRPIAISSGYNAVEERTAKDAVALLKAVVLSSTVPKGGQGLNGGGGGDA